MTDPSAAAREIKAREAARELWTGLGVPKDSRGVVVTVEELVAHEDATACALDAFAAARVAEVEGLLRELAAGCSVADALWESTLGMTVHEGDVTVNGGNYSTITDAALRKWAVRAVGLIRQLPWTVAGYPSLRERIDAALRAPGGA